MLAALQGLAVALETATDLTDPAVALPLLRSRIVTEGSLLLEDAVQRPLASGLMEVLVAEVAGAVTLLSPSLVEGWGIDPAVLLQRGREQVLAGPLPGRRIVELDGITLMALESASAFTPTHVHRLPAYLDVPPAGALVVLPTRHLLLAAPVTNRSETLATAQLLLVNADQMWRAGPGSLSPDLWWWRAQGLVHLPGTPTSLTPPGEFLTILDRLP